MTAGGGVCGVVLRTRTAAVVRLTRPLLMVADSESVREASDVADGVYVISPAVFWK